MRPVTATVHIGGNGATMSRWTGAALATAMLAGLLQLISILGAPPASACMCAARSEADLLRGADVVFAGTVADSRSSAVVTFAVSRVFKRDVRPTTKLWASVGHRVDVPDGLQVASSCDVDYRDAAQWLVYANRDHGKWYATICSGTRPLPATLPAVLGVGHAPRHPPEMSIDVPVRGPVPWLAAGGVGILLLAVPGWLVLRARRRRGES